MTNHPEAEHAAQRVVAGMPGAAAAPPAQAPPAQAPPVAAPAPPGQAPAAEVGDLTDELIRSDQWTDDMVKAAGIPVTDVPFVSIGGGIGSFVTVDYLRIAGVRPDRMRILSDLDFAWQRYEYLTRVSQIPQL